MFRTADGEEIFVIDAHVHWWDGSPANQLNRHGAEFINCFHDYHKGLSPEEYLWTAEQFGKYTPETMYNDLFVNGYDDIGICQPTYLKDFYRTGFNTTEQNAHMKELHPNRFILNGAFDPRDEEAGLDYLESLAEKYGIKGVKLYTAEWKGASKGYKLSDPWAQRYLEKCQKLGVVNIHVHKGPTILPLNRDAFDVADIDDAATSFCSNPVSPCSFRDRVAHRQKRGAPDVFLRQLEFMPKRLGNILKHADRFGGDFRANAVPGENGEVEQHLD